MNGPYREHAQIFKALCDENRLRILEQLRGDEQCACRLIEHLGMLQSALSYHMKILLESGFVASRQEGKWTYYRIREEGYQTAVLVLRELTMVTQNKGDRCD